MVLWTNIRFDHPAKFVKLIIERSKAHPLSLAWDSSRSHDLDSNNEEFKSMVELVTRNSPRLRSMEVTVGRGSQQTLRRLLDCPKPRLESLYVNLSPLEFDDAASSRFRLSEGSPLKELVLDSAGLLNWDSQRLSGLRVLNLRRPANLPSISQILLILSTSPLLTQLKLWDFGSRAGIPSAQTEQISGEKLIELPHLKTISIRDLPPSYCTSILSRILPRFCEYVDVMEYQLNSANTMPGEMFRRERSDTMVALLQLSKLYDPNSAGNSRLSIRVTDSQIMIENVAQPESCSSELWFGHTDAHHALGVLGEFFSGLDFKMPSLYLQLEEAPIWKHKQLDLHQWSCSLESLHVDGSRIARAVYEVLAQQLLLEDGTMGWICPRLSYISLFYGSNSYVDDSEDTEMDDGLALLLAVQKRWSGENEIPAAAQPKEFCMMIKPPRKEAITKALALVMDSIGTENGSQLVYQDRAKLDSSALEILTEAENALDVAKSYISKGIDEHIAYIRCYRNRATPFHQLPAEVLTIIIEIVLTRDYLAGVDERRMVKLMMVNRIWREIIINSPQLWTTIRTRNPPDFTELSIERSKPLPLSLTWHTSDDLDTTNKKFEALLDLVIRYSSRLRSMDINMGHGSGQTLQRLLGCPTPQLENLRVRTPQYGVSEYPRFTLSDGGPLKNLTLKSVGLLDWDSWRLSGLRLLDVENPAVAPAINQILHILSASPSLWRLRLCNLPSSENIPTTRSEEEDRQDKPIELPHLKTIRIERLPPSYCASILSRIRPGLCKYVQVEDHGLESANGMHWEKLWRERGDTMAALLQLSELSPLTLANDRELFIDVTGGRVMIVNEVLRGSAEQRSYFCFGFTDSCRAIEGLGEFFCSLDIPLRPISLYIAECPIWKQRQLDLCPWSNVLGTLQVGGIHLIRAVYQLLGQHWTMKDGTVTWVCPRLSDVELRYAWNEYMADSPEMDGIALLLAVQKRWAGGNGILALPQPSLFRVRCPPKTLPSIESRAETIKSIIPCFELTEEY
ncbi:hypothetical protein FRC05_008996 [Tulasnella sp. 425]|nr:hypothetical protein FRC05_008996 [Tulasnella sp. 425]